MLALKRGSIAVRIGRSPRQAGPVERQPVPIDVGPRLQVVDAATEVPIDRDGPVSKRSAPPVATLLLVRTGPCRSGTRRRGRSGGSPGRTASRGTRWSGNGRRTRRGNSTTTWYGGRHSWAGTGRHDHPLVVAVGRLEGDLLPAPMLGGCRPPTRPRRSAACDRKNRCSGTARNVSSSTGFSLL